MSKLSNRQLVRLSAYDSSECRLRSSASDTSFPHIIADAINNLIAPIVVPHGHYCYDHNGRCPFWKRVRDKDVQESGYCSLLRMGDWEGGIPLLWDQVKECRVNIEDEDDEDD